MERWELKATSFTSGFALLLIGDGDLGGALYDADSVEVEMEDGRRLPLFHALLELISARVIGFVVLTEQVDDKQVNLGDHQVRER